VATEAAQAAQQAAAAAQQRAQAADIVTQDLDRALGLVDEGWTTGLAGGALSRVPGTAAHDLNQVLQSVRANIGFDRLQAMREASPTGGALGAISEREMDLLQSVAGSVETSQSAEQLRRNLLRLQDTYNSVVHGPAGGVTPTAPQAPRFGDIQDGYRFKGGDPADPNSWDPIR
jgi:hypothetical protein